MLVGFLKNREYFVENTKNPLKLKTLKETYYLELAQISHVTNIGLKFKGQPKWKCHTKYSDN